MTPVMDMPQVVCAGCDTPIPVGSAYSQQLVAPELVVIVCLACAVTT